MDLIQPSSNEKKKWKNKVSHLKQNRKQRDGDTEFSFPVGTECLSHLSGSAHRAPEPKQLHSRINTPPKFSKN